MKYKQIISSRFYVRINQFQPSKELFHSIAKHFSTSVNKLNIVNGIHFIHFHAVFPLGRVARTTALGGLGISHGQEQFQLVLLAPHQDGTKQGHRCSHSTWSLTTSGLLSCEFSQQDVPHQLFVGHSAHTVELTQMWSLNSEKWFDIQGFVNFTAACFVARCHTRGVRRRAK